MAVLDANEIMFTAFEPKVQNRFIMYIDGIPSYLIKTATAPGFEAGEIILVDVSDETDTATFTFKGTPKSALPDTPGDLAEATN